MRKVRLTEKRYHTGLLDQQMRQVIGDLFLGLSGVRDAQGNWLPDTYDADLDDTAPASTDNQVRAIANAHDGTQKTAEDLAEEARRNDFDAFNQEAASLLGKIEGGTATATDRDRALALTLRILDHLTDNLP